MCRRFDHHRPAQFIAEPRSLLTPPIADTVNLTESSEKCAPARTRPSQEHTERLLATENETLRLPNSILAAFLLTVLASAPIALAQTIVPPSDAPAQLQKIFASFDHPDTPGCAVGVSLANTPVFTAAYGMADLEHNIPLTPTSILEPGSITKQFTAAAILLLAQDGKLSLEDPIRKYLPELPPEDAAITIRHLLNHTSGLRDWGSVAAIAGAPRFTRTYNNTYALDITARQHALNYPVGSAYSYTNTGFNLLAIIAERVAGQSLPAFTRERIFLPLGMTSTQWRDDYQRIVPNRALAYTQTAGVTRLLMPFENVYGNGGLLTTIPDLLRWNSNFTEMKVGGPTFIAAQLQQGHLTNGRTIAYAAGLEVLQYKGLREVSHSGSTAGYQAWLARYPDQRLSVALLCNSTTANPIEMGHRVADVYLTRAQPKSVLTRASALDAASLKDKAGLYRSDRDHSIVTVAPGDTPAFSFETNAEGHVTGLTLENQVDGPHHYDKVAPATPTPAELQSMVGKYSSDEAEVILTVALENNALAIHRRPDSVIPLKATYRDAFSSSIGTVRFFRDSTGLATEMSIGQDRVWDLRLKRIP